MWIYNSSSGELLKGLLIGDGYSGCGEGLNNPDKEQVADVGPIPRGSYRIGTFFDDPGGKGPCVAHLTPEPGTNVFGRSGFMIHGDNSAQNHTASLGCVIQGHIVREYVRASMDSQLTVV